MGKPISLFPALVLLAACGGGGSEVPAALGDRASEYAEATGTASASAPYVRGKVVPIDEETGEIDADVYDALPDQLRAGSPEEVGTVVKLEFGEDEVGEYDDGSNAIQEEAFVTIVDREQGIVFDNTDLINGPDPPEEKSGGGDVSGGKPDDEIAEYLAELPVAGPGETPVEIDSAEVVIELTDQGIVPSRVTAELGDVLVVKNAGKRPHDLVAVRLYPGETPESVDIAGRLATPSSSEVAGTVERGEALPEGAAPSEEEIGRTATPVLNPGESFELPIGNVLAPGQYTDDPAGRTSEDHHALVMASDFAEGRELIAELIVVPDSGKGGVAPPPTPEGVAPPAPAPGEVPPPALPVP